MNVKLVSVDREFSPRTVNLEKMVNGGDTVTVDGKQYVVIGVEGSVTARGPKITVRVVRK
jgi:hypothetical protein